MLFTPLKCKQNINPSYLRKSNVLVLVHWLRAKKQQSEVLKTKAKTKVSPFGHFHQNGWAQHSPLQAKKGKGKAQKDQRGFALLLDRFKLDVKSHPSISSMMLSLSCTFGPRGHILEEKE